MPELLSVHGRCPRCSQVLIVPAGQLQNVFRCARCQYRAAAAALVDEARKSPPRLAAPFSRLGAFEEDTDDQHTRVVLPGGPDDESERALEAIASSGARARVEARIAELVALAEQATNARVLGAASRALLQGMLAALVDRGL